MIELCILALDVLILIRFKKLLLCILMLFVLGFKVAQLTIHLVQSVLVILDHRVALTDLLNGHGNLLLLGINQCLDALNSLVVVLGFSCKNSNSFSLPFYFFVHFQLNISEVHQLRIILMVNFVLLTHHLLMVLDFLLQVNV